MLETAVLYSPCELIKLVIGSNLEILVYMNVNLCRVKPSFIMKCDLKRGVLSCETGSVSRDISPD